MKKFLDDDFFLTTDTSKILYHKYAKNTPIIDYHCHISPKEIYEDRQFENITQIWLGADHYKWRQMRSNGIEEKYITGNASDREKFQKWAKTLEMAIGNPLYHWSHLEIKRYFGYEGILKGDTAEEVWNLCNKQLAKKDYSARNLIRMSNVKVICTTDDPADSLKWHKKIKEDNFDVQVLPTWRPDKAMNIEKTDYLDYLTKLACISGINIGGFSDLINALRTRMDVFAENGCVISDHGMEYVMYEQASKDEIEKIFIKRIKGGTLTTLEELQFKTAFMLEMGIEYSKRKWAMQLHFGVQRDLNRKIYCMLGADVGIDAISNRSASPGLWKYLNALEGIGCLPKTILYSLNPVDNAYIGTIMGCFQNADAIGKIQHGSAWWFNDNKQGMKEQMISLANQGLLGNFIGMLTDSRSFLSYTRHEYFRRIMCDLIGKWVEDGEYPEDYDLLEKIVKGISYDNAARYFGFELNQ